MNTIATIRRTRLADARAISALSNSQIENGLPPRWNATYVVKVLRLSDTNAYSLFCNDLLSGFTIASFGQHRMHIMLHAIAPSRRRLGLGTRLLEWQIDAALVAGITEATLEVRAGNTNALAFYRKLRFEPGKLVRGYYAYREDAVRMRRKPLHSA